MFFSSLVEADAPGWGDITVILNPYGGVSPTIIHDKNNTVWVARRAWVPGGDVYADIWISNSSDGMNWSSPVMIVNCTASTGACDMPSLMRDPMNTYWLVYVNSPNSTNKQDLWIENSSNGINWSVPIPVVVGSKYDLYPSLMQNSTGAYWIAFESQNRGADNDIYYVTSQDGLSWSSPQLLNYTVPSTTYWDYEPHIMQDHYGKYWLAWTCGIGSNDNICVSNSSDGNIWSTPREVIIGTHSHASILEGFGTYWLTWHDDSVGTVQIWFSTSTNGINWSSPIQMTTHSSGNQNARIAIDSNGTVWTAFETARWGQSNISLTHSTVTLTSPNASEILSGTKNISFVSISGDYKNDSFSLYYSNDSTIWTLINNSIPADSAYTAKNQSWNTSNVSDGTYKLKIIRMNSRAGHTETNISPNFTINNPPASVSSLTSSAGTTSINFTWTNPSNADFNGTMVYLDGAFIANVSNTTNYYLASSLSAGTSHTLSLRTFDIAGNINLTWVNLTATTSSPTSTTAPASSSSDSTGITQSKSASIQPSTVEESARQYVSITETSQPTVVTFDTTEVSAIELKVTEAVSQATVSVQSLSALPSGVPPPSSPSYSYLSISVAKSLGDKISEAKVSFKVAKSWITENEIDTGMVALNKYSETSGSWISLPTTKKSESETEINYEAQTTGFSIFAITGEKVKETAVVLTTPTPSPVSTPEATATVTYTGMPAGTPAETPKPSEFWILFAIVVFLAVVYLLWRRMRLSK